MIYMNFMIYMLRIYLFWHFATILQHGLGPACKTTNWIEIGIKERLL